MNILAWIRQPFSPASSNNWPKVPLNAPLVIGIDFDNTIVCYDALFHKVSRERGWITADVPANKSEVRNYLRQADREDDWTELQGYVYGARMGEATLFPGVMEFFRACRAAGHTLCIISHKTKFPFKGEKYDLHGAALKWLDQQGFFSETGAGLVREQVYLELTKQAKLARIAAQGCTHFIDDLPEFLAEPAFPAKVHRVLFDPGELYGDEQRFARITNWSEARKICLC